MNSIGPRRGWPTPAQWFANNITMCDIGVKMNIVEAMIHAPLCDEHAKQGKECHPMESREWAKFSTAVLHCDKCHTNKWTAGVGALTDEQCAGLSRVGAHDTYGIYAFRAALLAAAEDTP